MLLCAVVNVLGAVVVVIPLVVTEFVLVALLEHTVVAVPTPTQYEYPIQKSLWRFQLALEQWALLQSCFRGERIITHLSDSPWTLKGSNRRNCLL